MYISISNEVLSKYPQAAIGYLAANVAVKQKDPFVEELKLSLKTRLQELGINPTNYTAHPNISVWRKIYREDFQVKETRYRSSIESLLRRVVTGRELWNICNIVDLYNCCSILTLLPMGGYDLGKILGPITIRYAKESETFQGIGERTPVLTNPNHIVYADEKQVLCWLWNHKDASETCIDTCTKKVIFFIDAVQPESSSKIRNALDLLEDYLLKIQAVPVSAGVLDRDITHVNLQVEDD